MLRCGMQEALPATPVWNARHDCLDTVFTVLSDEACDPIMTVAVENRVLGTTYNEPVQTKNLRTLKLSLAVTECPKQKVWLRP